MIVSEGARSVVRLTCHTVRFDADRATCEANIDSDQMEEEKSFSNAAQKPFPFHTRRSMRNYVDRDRKAKLLPFFFYFCFCASCVYSFAGDHGESNYFRNGIRFLLVFQFRSPIYFRYSNGKVVQESTIAPLIEADKGECVGVVWLTMQAARWRMTSPTSIRQVVIRSFCESFLWFFFFIFSILFVVDSFASCFAWLYLRIIRLISFLLIRDIRICCPIE